MKVLVDTPILQSYQTLEEMGSGEKKGKIS